MYVYNIVRKHSVQRRAGGANMQVRVIGVPMDLGADRRGVDIGASAIRYAGLNDQLSRLNYEVHDVGNIVVPQPESQPIGSTQLKYLEPILKVTEELADAVTSRRRIYNVRYRSTWHLKCYERGSHLSRKSQ